MITYEIYDLAGAPTLNTNTIDDQLTSAELYLTSAQCADISPTTSWTLVMAAAPEQDLLALFRDASAAHEIKLRSANQGAPSDQGTRIGPYEVRRVRVRSGWSLWVRAKP